MKKTLLLLLIVFSACELFAQRTTMDTIFTQSSSQAYRVRIWYDPSITDSSQGIFFVVGLGEMNTSIGGLEVAGPFNYKNAGWDGSVELENGKHYPIIIGIQPAATAFGWPDFIGPRVFDWAMNRFRIKKNSVHWTGLSQGGWTSNLLVTYQASSGVLTYGPRVKSVVNVQGVVPDDTRGATPAYPGRFSAYANAGGREVGIWATGDASRGIPDIVSTMNAAKANSGIEIITGGGHNNWYRYYGGATVPDNYTIDGTVQNIYQWMLRQGDTVNTYHIDPGGNIPPVANAGPDQATTLPLSSVYLSGAATDADGTISVYAWTKVSGGSATITSASSATAKINDLLAGTYVFRLTVTDNVGATGTDDVTVVVSAEPSRSYTKVGQGEYQAFLIQSTGKLWGLSVGAAAVGAGVSTGAAIPPLEVSVPNGTLFRDVASGLHHSLACDVDGNVWTWGWNEVGQSGMGNNGVDIYTPQKILTDTSGAAFTGVIQVIAAYSFNAYSYNVALKKDGTVWAWGNLKGGLIGNGTEGDTCKRPVQIVIPGNRIVKKIQAAQVIIALCTDGTVWAWGSGGARVHNLGRGVTTSGATDYKTPAQVIAIPSNIVDIAGGDQFSYALTSLGVLWGWGYYGCYLSIGTGGYENNTPTATPVNLTSTLGLPTTVSRVAVNSVCTHVILSNGTLWGWGDNAVGSIGNGSQVDWSSATSPNEVYAWSLGPGQLMVQEPVQITSFTDWVDVFGGTAYVFYRYAVRSGGQLYSWGRNKTGVLGNGIIGPHSSIIATYPDSWNNPTPTAVNPIALTQATILTSPYCLANPSGSPCNLYTPPDPPIETQRQYFLIPKRRITFQ